MDLVTYAEIVKDIPGGEECLNTIRTKKTCSIIVSNETGEDRLVLIADHDPENWLISFSTKDNDALVHILKFALDFELPLTLKY